jgi:hypothetical protein
MFSVLELWALCTILVGYISALLNSVHYVYSENTSKSKNLRSLCSDFCNSNAFPFAWFNDAAYLQVLLPRIANLVVFLTGISYRMYI